MSERLLFLATLADGSIIEFEPLPPAVASVFAETIHAADVEELQSVVVTRVFDRYAAAKGTPVKIDSDSPGRNRARTYERSPVSI